LYIPVQFYICKNPGLAVPLVALLYHKVNINIEFRPIANYCYYATVVDGSNAFVGNSTPPAGARMASAALLVDYVFLDERWRFAQVSPEYLITKLQTTGDDSSTT
jgi:hypothetical protein